MPTLYVYFITSITGNCLFMAMSGQGEGIAAQHAWSGVQSHVMLGEALQPLLKVLSSSTTQYFPPPPHSSLLAPPYNDAFAYN